MIREKDEQQLQIIAKTRRPSPFFNPVQGMNFNKKNRINQETQQTPTKKDPVHFVTSPQQHVEIIFPVQPEDIKENNSLITEKYPKSNISNVEFSGVIVSPPCENSFIKEPENETPISHPRNKEEMDISDKEQRLLDGNMKSSNTPNAINSMKALMFQSVNKRKQNLSKQPSGGPKYKQFIINLMKTAYIPSDFFLKSAQKKLLRGFYESQMDGVYLKQMTQNKLFNYEFQIFQPDGLFVQLWDLTRLILTLLILIGQPYRVAFGFPEAVLGLRFLPFDIITIIFYTINLTVQLNRAVIVHGQVIDKRSEIMKMYLQRDIYYDITGLSILCLNSLVFDSPEYVWIYCISLLIYYISTLKFYHNFQIVERYFNHTEQLNLWIGLLESIAEVVFFVHILACFWHGQAFYSYDRANWIMHLQLQDTQNSIRYNYAFQHIALLFSSIGYPNLENSQSEQELSFLNGLIIISYVTFAYTINKFGILMRQAYKNNVQKKLQFRQIRRYLRNNNINQLVRNQVGSYYQFMCDQEEKLSSEQPIQLIKKFSSALKQQIQFQLRKNSLDHMNSLKVFSKETLSKVQGLVEEVQFSPEDVIIKEGQTDDTSVYFIQKGEVQMKVFASDDYRPIQIVSTLKEGQTFGEYGFFTGLKRTATIVSYGYTKLIKITRDVMVKAIESNIIDKEIFAFMRDKLLIHQDLTILNIKCFSCGEKTHFGVDCPLLHYKADKERVIKKLLFPHVQQRVIRVRKARKTRTLSNLLNIQSEIKQYQQDVLFEEPNQISSVDELSESQLPYDDLNLQTSQTRITAQRSFNYMNSLIGNPMDVQSYSGNLDIKDDIPENFNLDDFLYRTGQAKNTYNTAGFGHHSQNVINICNNKYQIKESNHMDMHVIQEKSSLEDSSSDSSEPQSNPRQKRQIRQVELFIPTRIKEPKLTFNQTYSLEQLHSLQFTQQLEPDRDNTDRKNSLLVSQRTSQPIKNPNTNIRQSQSRSQTCAANMENQIIQKGQQEHSQQSLNISQRTLMNNNNNASQHSASRNFASNNNLQKEECSPGRQVSQVSNNTRSNNMSQFASFDPIDVKNNNPNEIVEWGILEFEKIQNYQFYFPEFNVDLVIKRMNKFLNKKVKKIEISKYTLSYSLMKRSQTVRKILQL